MSSTYTTSAPTVVRTESIAELTSVIGAAQEVKFAGTDKVNFVLVPPGYSVKTFEGFSDPAAVRQKIDLDTIESFIDYVLQFGHIDSAIFAAVTSSAITLVGIIDYHSNEGIAKRCGHVAEFVAKPTQEWLAVVGLHRKEISQEEFALFLEEHHRLFILPAGSDLLELVLNLQGKSNVAFTSMRRLQNGANQLMYEEEVELKGGGATSMLAGTMELPSVLRLAVPPFEGESPYEIEVRLRYKISGRRLTFSLEMIRLHAIVRDAARIMLERVKEKVSAVPIPIYLGKTKASPAPTGTGC